MDTNSFSFRVALLLGLMVAMSLWDFHRNGQEAARFHEYGYILTAGVIGAGFGSVNDLVTSSISPDYFILGKGLELGPGFRMQAGLYGMRVGFSAGIIGGAVSLFAARRESIYAPLRLSTLFKMLWMPVVGAILFGLLLPVGFSRFDPANFAALLKGMMGPAEISRFRQVWWTHVGVYVGMALGLTAMLIYSIRARKSSSPQIAMSE